MPKYTNRQQLLSTRTVANIAEQVHNKELDKLISRKYLYTQYDPYDNLFIGSQPIDWEGNIVRMYNIRKTDNATVANTVVVNDPDTMRNETTQAAEDGANIIAPIYTMNGHRLGDIINVHAVSALVRIHVVRNESNEIPVSYTDRVKLRFGFYLYRKVTANGILDSTNIPDIRSVVKWNPFGYSSKLDNLEAGVQQGLPYATRNLAMLMNSEKTTKLIEKEVTVKVPLGPVNVPEYRQYRIYKEFKDPIEIQYSPLSQDGDDVLNHQLFWAIRSDLPTAIKTQIYPNVQVCTKIYYSNPN